MRGLFIGNNQKGLYHMTHFSPEEIKAYFSAKREEFSSLVGIELLDISIGFCKCKLALRPELMNSYGIIHGGCTYTLADTVSGIAALSHGKQVVTLNGSINYLAPASNTAALYAEATEVKYGSKIAVYRVNITNEESTLIANGDFSLFILE